VQYLFTALWCCDLVLRDCPLQNDRARQKLFVLIFYRGADQGKNIVGSGVVATRKGLVRIIVAHFPFLCLLVDKESCARDENAEDEREHQVGRHKRRHFVLIGVVRRVRWCRAGGRVFVDAVSCLTLHAYALAEQGILLVEVAVGFTAVAPLFAVQDRAAVDGNRERDAVELPVATGRVRHQPTITNRVPLGTLDDVRRRAVHRAHIAPDDVARLRLERPIALPGFVSAVREGAVPHHWVRKAVALNPRHIRRTCQLLDVQVKRRQGRIVVVVVVVVFFLVAPSGVIAFRLGGHHADESVRVGLHGAVLLRLWVSTTGA